GAEGLARVPFGLVRRSIAGRRRLGRALARDPTLPPPRRWVSQRNQACADCVNLSALLDPTYRSGAITRTSRPRRRPPIALPRAAFGSPPRRPRRFRDRARRRRAPRPPRP